jgi:lysophospholipase L1-like esterase
LQFTRILAYGDSMTEGHATPQMWGTLSVLDPGVARSYPAKLQTLVSALYTGQTVQIFNGGRGGAHAFEDLERMHDVISLTQPEVMILMEGVNDINSGRGVAAAAAAVEDLVRGARGRGVRVLLSTITRINPLGTKRLETDHLVQPFNAELAHIAATKDATLVDVHPHIPLELVAPDGLHLTQQGNQTLAEIYFAKLRELYELPPEGVAVAIGPRPRAR